MRVVRLLACVVVLTFVAASCSSSEGPTTGEAARTAAPTATPEPTVAAGAAQATPPGEPTPKPEEAVPTPASRVELGPPVVGPVARDRIVVATEFGGLYLVDPDGGNRLDLATEGGPPASQPVWSPDGRRIGWSQGDASGFGITTANIDGTELRRARTPFGGYYGYWDPTSATLGFLGNAPPGTGLVLDNGTGADLESTVDSDTFYYFSWNPTGTEWIVHSGSGFRIVALDGTEMPIPLDAAMFRAPVWARDGTIILAIATPGGSTIVRYDPETEITQSLLEAGEIVNFVLDPTGRRLAIESLDLGAAPEQDGIETVSIRQGAPSAEVIVFDLETGEQTVAYDQFSGGFWWSPDGTKLAILTAETNAGFVRNRWRVWSDSKVIETEPFVTTSMFAAWYVPFFDQFAQSVTIWSPDSSRFVYVGTNLAGEDGVFVQSALEAEIPTLIAPNGAVAFWSPT